MANFYLAVAYYTSFQRRPNVTEHLTIDFTSFNTISVLDILYIPCYIMYFINAKICSISIQNYKTSSLAEEKPNSSAYLPLFLADNLSFPVTEVKTKFIPVLTPVFHIFDNDSQTDVLYWLTPLPQSGQLPSFKS